MIPSIFVGFVLLDALLLWAVIYGRGRWALKLAAILVVLAFNFTTWHALDSYRGWPTPVNEPPADAVYVDSIVNEPDNATGDPGSIYLWLVPIRHGHTPLGYSPADAEPRAYRLPYSEPLYRAVVAAQRIRKGGGQAGLRRAQRPAHAARRSTGSGDPLRSRFQAYKLPPTQPPTK